MSGLQTFASKLPGISKTYIKQMIHLLFKFASETQTEDVINDIYQQAVSTSNPFLHSCNGLLARLGKDTA